MAASCASAREHGLIDGDRTAAIDATGLETGQASTHFLKRCGRSAFATSAWPKLTAVFDAATHLIVGAVVGRGPSQDSPDFPEAMRQAAANLRPKRLLADKAYDAEHNHVLCRRELGIRSTAIPLNPRNATGPPKTRYRRMMHDRFPVRQYRQRAQAESGFSRHKRRLGSALSARSDPTRRAEIYLRVVTQNVMIVASHI